MDQMYLLCCSPKGFDSWVSLLASTSSFLLGFFSLFFSYFSSFFFQQSSKVSLIMRGGRPRRGSVHGAHNNHSWIPRKPWVKEKTRNSKKDISVNFTLNRNKGHHLLLDSTESSVAEHENVTVFIHCDLTNGDLCVIHSSLDVHPWVDLLLAKNLSILFQCRLGLLKGMLVKIVHRGFRKFWKDHRERDSQRIDSKKEKKERKRKKYNKIQELNDTNESNSIQL